MTVKKERKKLSTNAKKIIVLGSLVGILVVTGVLNFVLNDKITDKDTSNPAGLDTSNAQETFFSSYRSDRETARNEEFSYLDAIITSTSSTEEVISTAESKKLELLANIERELVVENLIKAKGFDDVVVTMSTNNINVIVDKAELDSSQVSQILSVILAETDYKANQVVVVPYSV